MPLRAKNLQHISDILKDTKKNFGSIDDVVKKELYDNGGTGSFFADMAVQAPKKILRFGGSKEQKLVGKKMKTVRKDTVGDRVTDSLENGISRYKKKLTDLDIRAGNAVASKLKDDSMLQKAFVGKRQFKVSPTAGNNADELVEVKVPMLSEPLNKAKDKVLPFIGAMTAADLMNKMVAKPEDGVNVVDKKASLTKAQLIEKIAGAVEKKEINLVIHNEDKVFRNKFDKLASASYAATEMLKEAAEQIRSSEETIQKLAAENRYFRLNLIAKERSDRAVKLASVMQGKGLIKKAAVEEQIDKIMDMSDETYEVLASTIESLIEKKASSGTDDLFSLMAGSEPSMGYGKKTLAEAILKQ